MRRHTIKAAPKWYRVEAGNYRAEPTPHGSRFFAGARWAQIKGGDYWVYGTRIDGKPVVLGDRETLKQCKYACELLAGVSDEELRSYEPHSDPARALARAAALRETS